MSILKVNSVTLNFGGLCALNNFSLTVEKDEIFGIIGPNGSGKTTSFNVISGIYRPQKGTITFNNHDITKARPEQIVNTGIARTFQNIRLFKELTVLDNIRVALYKRYKYSLIESIFHFKNFQREEVSRNNEAMQMLSLFKMEDSSNTLAKNLPYGTQKRLEIIRALSTNPSLLMLDEPAAGMNPREVKELMEFILWIRDNFHISILLIEHQMRLVTGICERVKVLDFGITIAEGRPHDVCNNPDVVKAFLGFQKN